MKLTCILLSVFLLSGCGSQNTAILPNSEAAKRAAAAPPAPTQTIAPPLAGKPGK
ncbi:MAG: hypothetical protein QM703_07830 [Gemmatales bacterium]